MWDHNKYTLIEEQEDKKKRLVTIKQEKIYLNIDEDMVNDRVEWHRRIYVADST